MNSSYFIDKMMLCCPNIAQELLHLSIQFLRKMFSFEILLASFEGKLMVVHDPLKVKGWQIVNEVKEVISMILSLP